MVASLRLPGFVNAHSHTFQRALRGSSGGDFWAWREAMLAEAARQTPRSVRIGYARTYRHMLASGYTAVGEFHYLGLPEALAAAEAARQAGIDLVLLHVAYGRGGIDRFRQPSVAAYLNEVEALASAGIPVGLAPHSVRACPASWLREIGRYGERQGLLLHVHADEQPREIEHCLAEHGRRPIELLADTGCLSPRTTVVHATHATDGELDLIAQTGARVCLCPTTEADLGDGFAPVGRLLERGIPLCIGSDSNVRIDPLEELRQLEGIARRAAGRRQVLPVEELLRIGAAHGAAALGLAQWADVEVDLHHPDLRGIPRRRVAAALAASCTAAVFRPPR